MIYHKRERKYVRMLFVVVGVVVVVNDISIISFPTMDILYTSQINRSFLECCLKSYVITFGRKRTSFFYFEANFQYEIVRGRGEPGNRGMEGDFSRSIIISMPGKSDPVAS